jgi:hypothetical protein
MDILLNLITKVLRPLDPFKGLRDEYCRKTGMAMVEIAAAGQVLLSSEIRDVHTENIRDLEKSFCEVVHLTLEDIDKFTPSQIDEITSNINKKTRIVISDLIGK